MEEDIKGLEENYKILIEFRDYVLTTDNRVLKKDENGRYFEADDNDEIVIEMRKMMEQNNNFVNYDENVDDSPDNSIEDR